MTLSVIMPVYNREAYVGAALRSLLRQTGRSRSRFHRGRRRVHRRFSNEAVRSLMSQTSRIRLFEQPNMGVTRARKYRAEAVAAANPAGVVSRFGRHFACGAIQGGPVLFRKHPNLELTYSRMTLVDHLDGETWSRPPAAIPSPCVASTCPPGSSPAASSTASAASTRNSGRPRTQTICCGSLRATRNTLCPIRLHFITGATPGNMTKEADVPFREFMRAIYKSMKRRRSDPGLRRIEGIFDFKDLAQWRFL